MAERLGTFQTAEGDVIYKQKQSNGQVAYQRGPSTSSGKRGGTYIDTDLGRSLEKAARSSTDETTTQPDQAQIITPTGERDRDAIIRQKYLRYSDAEGRKPRQIDGSASVREMSIKTWMDNENLKQQIDNDPLLETDEERRKAQEALAIEVADELENVESEGQRVSILRDYNLAS